MGVAGSVKVYLIFMVWGFLKFIWIVRGIYFFFNYGFFFLIVDVLLLNSILLLCFIIRNKDGKVFFFVIKY